MIIETTNNHQCEVAHIINTNGQESLGLSGTAERKHIGEIVDNWDLNHVLTAWMRYIEDNEPIGKSYDLLRKSSLLPPIELR